MAETWFDTRNGELLVGSAAIEQRLPETSPGDVVPLKELLTAEHFPISYKEFAKSPSSEWTRDGFITLGQWAVNILQDGTPEKVMLMRKHMDRLHILGLGARFDRQKYFQTMGIYRHELGEARGIDHRRYNDWSTKDFVKYASELSTQLGWRPRKEDYVAADGPGLRIIRDRFGSISVLNELIGYPYFRTWKLVDYIDWGVRIVGANESKDIAHDVVRELSKKQRSPGPKAIIAKFGSWNSYKRQVLEEYYHLETDKAIKKQAKAEQYAQMLKAGELPSRLKIITNEELCRFAGRYLLAKQLLDHSPDTNELALQIAGDYSSPIIGQIKQHNATVKAADIETEAVILGVFDDIWPMVERDEALKIA